MKNEELILAGGCFWGMEDLFRKIRGVIHTEVGYTGGKTKNPTYNSVKTGDTGHAEAIKIIYDPTLTSLTTLFDHFFRLHDPTTVDRQGGDEGSQYRSAIFYANEDQKAAALKAIEDFNKSGKWSDPIVTEVTKAGDFYIAEDHHQDYLQKFPEGYTCHFYRF